MVKQSNSNKQRIKIWKYTGNNLYNQSSMKKDDISNICEGEFLLAEGDDEYY